MDFSKARECSHAGSWYLGERNFFTLTYLFFIKATKLENQLNLFISNA